MRAFRLPLVVLFAVGAALPTSAIAKAAASAFPEKLAVEAMHNFSRCAVDRSPQSAVELLSLDFRSAEYRRHLKGFARGTSDCAPGSKIQFAGVLFAGAVAEHLLESRLGGTTLPQLVAYDPSKPAFNARDEVEMTALCTVRKAPEGVAELLQTAPATDKEDAALAALTPVISSCAPAGQQVRVNRPGLRSILALAAYRLAELKLPNKAGHRNIRCR